MISAYSTAEAPDLVRASMVAPSRAPCLDVGVAGNGSGRQRRRCGRPISTCSASAGGAPSRVDATVAGVVEDVLRRAPPRAKTMSDDDRRDGGDEQAVLDGGGALLVLAGARGAEAWLKHGESPNDV